MSDGFPNVEPDAFERLAELGVDPNRSLREWLGRLTGKTGKALDDLISEGARFGAGEPSRPPGFVQGKGFRASERRTLTAAERRVLSLCAIGLHSPEIAERTHRQRSTIQTQIKQARQKLGAHTITEAVVFALITGQLDLGSLAQHFSGRR